MLRQAVDNGLEALQRALPEASKTDPDHSGHPDAIIASGERFALLTPHEARRLIEAARLCEQSAETPEWDPARLSRLNGLLRLLLPGCVRR
jgi:hypothetical protein